MWSDHGSITAMKSMSEQETADQLNFKRIIILEFPLIFSVIQKRNLDEKTASGE